MGLNWDSKISKLAELQPKVQILWIMFKKSFTKLGLQLKMNDEELQSIHDTMSLEYDQKLNTFYQLRSIFAPLIEGLILLDRLTFLLEQPQVQEAHLVRLFDAVISPRCYALIVNKING